MKKIKSILALLFIIPVIAGCTSSQKPAVANITSIQAYTELAFYGQKLSRVEITYQDNVDLTALTPDSYILLDRGFANPDFARVTIASVDVNDQVATLNITMDTEALAANELIYSGDDATGSRGRNPLGAYVTGPWYRSLDGTIHFGEEDSGQYRANTTGYGYQTRASLELQLYHAGESPAEATRLADERGVYDAEGLWQPTIDANFGEDGFRTFEDLGIQVSTTATDGDDFVKGWAYFPPGYDTNRPEPYPLIISISGYGTSYWKHEDGTHNFGSGLYFDGSAFRWMDNDAIVLNIHDRSHTGGEDYKFFEDDYNVIRHFIQNYNADAQAITLTGNSRGTIAVQTIASTYPGLINTLILNNGFMGSGIAGRDMFEGVWSDEVWNTVAGNGTSIWVFDGEQDTENLENYQKAVSIYKSAGWSDEWIADNIRITGYPTGIFHYWGETDHSATKMTYWYFFDTPYYGPDATVVNGELVYNTRLDAGDSYQIKGRLIEGEYNKEGFNHRIYGESLRDWVLTRDYETR